MPRFLRSRLTCGLAGGLALHIVFLVTYAAVVWLGLLASACITGAPMLPLVWYAPGIISGVVCVAVALDCALRLLRAR